jgi:hypothetical protein
MNDLDHFLKLNIASTSVDNIKNRIRNADESEWIIYLEQNILLLDIEDLVTDTKIVQLIKDIGSSKRIGVYRTTPNTCYSWHFDSGRMSSINMLIEGFDSMCVFGVPAPSKQYINLSRLQHQPNTYYLMNVKKFHTVYNFGNQRRYVLSLGIPDKSFNEVRAYLKENDMI